MAKVSLDRHSLYEAAVQSVDADLDFVERVFKRRHGRRARRLREDFCGSASLACAFVTRHRKNRAWGIDLDAGTLDWGRRHRLAPLGADAERVELHCRDVRDGIATPVDVVVAFNFSFCVFKERAELEEYFRRVRQSLQPGGIFCLDLFGGSESVIELAEKSKKEGVEEPDGRRVPAFTYVWEQAYFNPIDHHIICHIHFKLPGRKRIRRAFTYDWRLWTLPELREILTAAGFAEVEVYVEGWDDDSDEGDGIFRRKRKFDNEGSWIAYVVGYRD